MCPGIKLRICAVIASWYS